MDEFRAELDGCAYAGQSARPATSANAIARLEDDYPPACFRELGGGSEARSTGTDDDDFGLQAQRLRPRISIGMIRCSACPRVMFAIASLAISP